MTFAIFAAPGVFARNILCLMINWLYESGSRKGARGRKDSKDRKDLSALGFSNPMAIRLLRVLTLNPDALFEDGDDIAGGENLFCRAASDQHQVGCRPLLNIARPLGDGSLFINHSFNLSEHLL
jgi:hypothetical protein